MYNNVWRYNIILYDFVTNDFRVIFFESQITKGKKDARIIII